MAVSLLIDLYPELLLGRFEYVLTQTDEIVRHSAILDYRFITHNIVSIDETRRRKQNEANKP